MAVSPRFIEQKYSLCESAVTNFTKEHVFRTRKPRFGVDYDIGWIAFNHAESNMSKLIAYLDDTKRANGVVVSHAMVISGKNECIEAAFPKGVVRSDLDEAYFDRDDRYVVFRKPTGLTPDIADRIVSAAATEVGTEYNHSVLITQFAKLTFGGWLIERRCEDDVSEGDLRKCVDRFIEVDSKWICSELAAYCLDRQPEYTARGVLAKSPRSLTPQELFEDEELFEPFPD